MIYYINLLLYFQVYFESFCEFFVTFEEWCDVSGIFIFFGILCNLKLSQLEGEQKEDNIEKYLPWSKDLPDEVLNYDGEYKELNFEE
jgi:hypothetical protein